MPVIAAGQSVIDIELGQTRTGKAGGLVDLYRFGGGSGTTIKATLTAPGSSALILYTPEGEEMLSARGDGTVTLEAILPLWDVFVLAVVRTSAAKAYTLELSGNEPDIHMAYFARGVGFRTSVGTSEATTCWVEPGVKKRTIFSDLSGWYTDTTIGRQGYEYSELFNESKKLVTKKTNRRRVEGGDVILDLDLGGSKPEQYRYAVEIESTMPRAYAC